MRNMEIMKKLRIVFLLLCAMLGNVVVQAQNTKIQGKVIEEGTDLEVPFATVKVLNAATFVGTTTDITGKFSVVAKVGDRLEVSYVGLETQTVRLTAEYVKSGLVIRMKTMVTQLEEVVAIGYGTARKRDLTGSIVNISGNDVKTSPNGSPIASLQGKVPGLSVTTSGAAGSSPDIKIRGVGTLNSSNNPLYVVDGMFHTDIEFLNQSDIQSMEVLKDPSSLAIFGVQGANGVIIITTKRADEGKINVNYDGYVGVQNVWRRDRVKLTNATQFTTLYNEQLHNQDPNAASWVPDMLGEGTDWLSKIMQSALVTNHNLSVSRSTDKSTNLFSGGYYKQEGVVKYNDYQRFSLRASEEYKVSKYVKLGGNIQGAMVDNIGASANVQQAVQAIPTYQPYAPEYEVNPEDIGSYYNEAPSIQSNRGNPVANMEIHRGTGKARMYRVLGNAFAEVSFLKDFTFRATGYFDFGFWNQWSYRPIYNQTTNRVDKRKISSMERKYTEARKYQGDFTLNYKKSLGKHDIGAMLGYTARKAQEEGFNATADSLVNGLTIIPEDMWMLSQGNPKYKANGDWWNSEAFISYLARVNYNYAHKYLFTATFRADGSSKFAPSHRWGYFPSVGAGWVISEESFFEPIKNTMDFLKLRASWGLLGNDKIGNYLYYPTINPQGKQVLVNGKYQYIATTAYNVDENLHWEVMHGFDIGIQGQAFNNRLNFDLGYYNKTTKDLLATVSLSTSVGESYQMTNAGSIRNSGFEFTLNWDDKIGDLKYGFNLNGATLRNRVVALGNDDAPIYSYGSNNYQSHITAVGHSIGSFYGYKQDGIFQNENEVAAYVNADGVMLQSDAKPGDIRYCDVNGDGVFNSKDRTFLGNSIPTFTYGFGLNLAWKGLDFSCDFYGVSGNKILDLKKTIADVAVNFYEKDLNRWHGEGTSNHEPILDKTRGNNYLMSDNLLEEGKYLRMRSAELGYTLPRRMIKAIGLNRARIYVSGQNLFTWKHNSGFTPEIAGGIMNGAVDQGDTYPVPSTYTVGVSLTF